MTDSEVKVEDFSSMILNTVAGDTPKKTIEDDTVKVDSLGGYEKTAPVQVKSGISVEEWKDLLHKLGVELDQLRKEMDFIWSFNKSEDDHVLFDSVLTCYDVAYKMCEASYNEVEATIKENRESRFNTTDEYIRWQYVCTDKESAVPSSILKEFDVFDPIIKKFKSMKPEELSSFTRYTLRRL